MRGALLHLRSAQYAPHIHERFPYPLPHSPLPSCIELHAEKGQIYIDSLQSLLIQGSCRVFLGTNADTPPGTNPCWTCKEKTEL